LSIAGSHREVELKYRSSKREQDKAGLAFLRLMKHLRTTFIQDIPWHRQRRPNHFLFTHALFADPEYITFERKALLVQPRTAQDFDDRLRVHAPHMTTVMQSNFAAIMTEVTSSGRQLAADTAQLNATVGDLNDNQFILKSTMEEQFKAMEDRFGVIDQQLAAVLYQTAPERTSPIDAEYSAALSQTLAGLQKMAELRLHGGASSSSSVQARTRATHTQVPLPPTTLAHLTVASSATPALRETARINSSLEPARIPFKFNRDIKTVLDTWLEYNVGTPVQGPLKPLRAKGGFSFAKTLGGQNDQRFWNRRVDALVQAVEKLAEVRKIPELEAAGLLDNLRRRSDDTVTLTRFGTLVKDKTGQQISMML
jgi:hypothetical protein